MADKYNFESFKEKYGDIIVAHREYACHLNSIGEHKTAIKHFITTINLEKDINNTAKNVDHSRASACYYALGMQDKAVEYASIASSLLPTNTRLLNNYGFLLLITRKTQQAEEILSRSLKIDADNIGTHDALAHLYGVTGNPEKVKAHGELALRLKDKRAMRSSNILWLTKQTNQPIDKKIQIMTFSSTSPDRNILSFSLWGNTPRYLGGALLNAQLAPFIYPGWTCRFYCDKSVPKDIKNQLAVYRAQIINMPDQTFSNEGLFWRFFVADDPNVDYFLIRDADAIINTQERTAVDEWLDSGKYFHIMRDRYCHTALIHAGMWGGIQGALPQMESLIEKYCKEIRATRFIERTIDQQFLGDCIWPIVKKNHLAHDSNFNFGNSKKFPRFGRFHDPSRHIGQNWSAVAGNGNAP